MTPTEPRILADEALLAELRRRVAEDDADPDAVISREEFKAWVLARLRQSSPNLTP